ncbi:hypothetical protein CAPTEDRAFT_203955 [Capitella teleta]|uniref:Uncharacterized protein n=1 Tax=Capitella teleta TaxID=283909 RepID=R7TL85_CAPTE|nr:hypothetical protein CAPTEDRAFT_203955 [Capitella teleta]|eukprot:ELT92291.1 hypothetical protein CAPTEDRAFT_203955 [Capitella teleta]
MPTETKDAKLSRLYRDPKEAGALRGVSGLQQISKNNHLGVLKRENAKRILKYERSYTLHGRVVNGAQNLTERIVSSWPFDMWEADLTEPPHARLQVARRDAGTEFFNAYADRVVYKPLGVNHYRAQKEPGASVVERFNQTLGRAIAKYISANPKSPEVTCGNCCHTLCSLTTAPVTPA